VFEALLSSKRLQFKLENEAFWLLLSWVEAQSEEREEGKQALFERMAKGLRFHDMDPGYMLLMVSEHPRIVAAGLQKKALTDSLVRANQARRSKEDSKGYWEFMVAPELGRWKGPPTPVMWTFEVRFSAVEAAALQPGEECRKIVGLVAGIPWYVELYHGTMLESSSEELEEEAFIYTNCSMPFKWTYLDAGGGFYFQYNIEVGVGTPRACNIEQDDLLGRCWTQEKMWGDHFGDWDDIFREGSGWLVDGELRVRVTVKATNDQGPSVSEDV
jgi:hypothetical protein